MEHGIVFNIERFATEDGKGIRTVVFLKGCGLHCIWCANPESQHFKPEVIYNENLCKGCGKCILVCQQKAIQFDNEFGYISDRKLCTGCNNCVKACLFNARTLSGKRMTSEELISEILKDESYFIMSGGGVTFSGGEPLYQSKFIREVSLILKKRDISTLVETCGYIPVNHIEDVLDVIDAIYFDIKHMDPKVHKKLTGADNKLILDNLKYINDNFNGELSVRYPYIPGYNDDLQNIDNLVNYVKSLDRVSELVFLPYHRLGLPKYRGLGRAYEIDKHQKSLKKNDLYFLLKRYENEPINLRIQ